MKLATPSRRRRLCSIVLAAGLAVSTSLPAVLHAQTSTVASDQVLGWAGKTRAELAVLLPGAEREYRVRDWNGWREVQLSYAQPGGPSTPERLVKAEFFFSAPVPAARAQSLAASSLGLSQQVTTEAFQASETAATTVPTHQVSGDFGYHYQVVARPAGERMEGKVADAVEAVAVYFLLPQRP